MVGDIEYKFDECDIDGAVAVEYGTIDDLCDMLVVANDGTGEYDV